MSRDAPNANPPDKNAGRAVLLFFGSGCAALIYEVVWFQLLQLVIGSSAFSLGVLLATFMGGTCLGNLLSPGLADSRLHPLRVYCLLELVIGISGVLLLGVIPLLGSVYVHFGGGRIAMRAVLAAICLLPPTMAMGATLPVMAKWLANSPKRTYWLGSCYTASLAGGIAGTLLAGFYLLRIFDLFVATGIAATMNVALALTAWSAADRTWNPSAVSTEVTNRECVRRSGPVYLTLALSGLTALSVQILWTRLLALSFGATTYAFSLVLAAFLSGLGAGSGLGTFVMSRRGIRPRVALGWCQILIAVATAWGAYLLTEAMPYWPVAETAGAGPWAAFRVDLFRTLLVVTPAAILWGASFPLALGSGIMSDRNAARPTGLISAANTAGALAGSLGTSVLLAISVGTQRIEQLMIAIAVVAGITALRSASEKTSTSAPPNDGMRYVEWAAIAVSGIVLALGVSPVPGVLIAFGRGAAEWATTSKYSDTGRILYQGEGVNEFVAVSRGSGGEMTFHATGKVQASTLAPDMRLELLLAHLSHLVPKNSSNALVIGCGAGITAGALSTAPGVGHITIAEIEPLVIQAASRYFGNYNHEVLHNPRVSIRIDDGRHFLTTTTESFDIITTDLVDPWVKGVAALFTREFFELAKLHLRTGGVVTQFVQLYQSNREAVKSEIGTFVEAFPDAVVWGNPREGEGYDLVLLGQKGPVRIEVDEIQALLDSPAYASVAESLRTTGIASAADLLKTYAGSGTNLKNWLSDAAINRDSNLRLQYLAGLGIGMDKSTEIYSEILRQARYPDEMFHGTPATIEALRQSIEAGWRKYSTRP
jgi:spermidine synthase